MRDRTSLPGPDASRRSAFSPPRSVMLTAARRNLGDETGPDWVSWIVTATMPGARITRVPVTDSVARCPMAQTEFRDNPRARCGLPSRRCTRRSDCSTPGVRFMPTRCSKMRGRQHARPTMLACGRVLPSLRLAVPTRRAATRKAPTGCSGGRPMRWHHMPARHRTASTSPSYERGPGNRNIEPCPACGGPQTTHTGKRS